MDYLIGAKEKETECENSALIDEVYGDIAKEVTYAVRGYSMYHKQGGT